MLFRRRVSASRLIGSLIGRIPRSGERAVAGVVRRPVGTGRRPDHTTNRPGRRHAGVRRRGPGRSPLTGSGRIARIDPAARLAARTAAARTPTSDRKRTDPLISDAPRPARRGRRRRLRPGRAGHASAPARRDRRRCGSAPGTLGGVAGPPRACSGTPTSRRSSAWPPSSGRSPAAGSTRPGSATGGSWPRPGSSAGRRSSGRSRSSRPRGPGASRRT